MMRIVGQCSTACMLVILLTGCYGYRPVQEPRPGADVRARLNAQAAVARSEGLNEPILIYSGTVIEADAESITLDRLVARDVSQFTRAEIRDTIVLRRTELQSIMAREISVTRTILFAGALGVGAYAIVSGIGGIVGGNEGEPEPGNPALLPSRMTRRRAFTIRIPIP